MSYFLTASLFGSNYFGASYLNGGQPVLNASSGWRRMLLAEIQEEALKKEPERVKHPEVTSLIIPFSPESEKKPLPKRNKRNKRNKRKQNEASPEEEIAKEILATLPKPIYRRSEVLPAVLAEVFISIKVFTLFDLLMKLSKPSAKSAKNTKSVETDDENLLVMLSVL